MMTEYDVKPERPVWAIQTTLSSDEYERGMHSHQQAQMILTLRGMVICQVRNRLWMVPPNYALWIPAELEHSAHRACRMCTQCIVLIRPDAIAGLRTDCCMFEVSPLLRELALAVTRMPSLYDLEGADGRLVNTLLDQLVTAPVERLHVGVPIDPRLRRISDEFVSNPGDRASLAEWADRVAMSVRSLQRLVFEEVGLSFGRWRQQHQIMHALKLLKSGESVQSVAFKLGYRSASAFTTMFRRALGEPPTCYAGSLEGSCPLAALQTEMPDLMRGIEPSYTHSDCEIQVAKLPN